MEKLKRTILLELLDGTAEPLLVARTDSPDWPVVLANDAFDAVAPVRDTMGRPFADVVEQLAGREFALEVSETVRAGLEASLPLELHNREYLLVLKLLSAGADSEAQFCAAYWRSAAGSAASDSDMRQALASAKRRIRDLSRDDPVTGLLNAAAFRDVLAHDWAVAAREQTSLALVCFSLDDFDAYQDVFGRHATDSCLRRVGRAIRRCLRRASDVAARIEREKFIVLSHASGEDGIDEFADRIAAAVRELKLHHPRSEVDRFVTVNHRSAVSQAGIGDLDAAGFLQQVLSR